MTDAEPLGVGGGLAEIDCQIAEHGRERMAVELASQPTASRATTIARSAASATANRAAATRDRPRLVPSFGILEPQPRRSPDDGGRAIGQCEQFGHSGGLEGIVGPPRLHQMIAAEVANACHPARMNRHETQRAAAEKGFTCIAAGWPIRSASVTGA